MTEPSMDKPSREDAGVVSIASGSDPSAAAERDRLRLLLAVTNAIVSELDIQRIVPTLSRLLSETIPHHFASLALWDEDAQVLRRHGLVHSAPTRVLQDGTVVHQL